MARSLTGRVTACAAICGVALTGCASPGGGASTHNDVSRCAAVLPTARDLVHSQGRLVLVRPVRQIDIDTIVRDAGQPAAPVASAGPASSAAPSAPRPSTPGAAPSAPTPSTPGAAPPPLAARPPSGPPHRPQGAHPQAGHPPAHPQGAHPGTPGRAPRLCLVVYQGSFRADAIPGAQPAGATGTYALIFLRVRHPSVDRTLVTNAVPASAHRPWWHF